MDVSRPYRAVVPTLDGDVLVALAGSALPLTGREVQRLVKRGSERGVAKALDRLVEQGLVSRQRAGRAYVHTLNRSHLAAGAVRALAGMRAEMLQRLRTELASWSVTPAHASLFGSAARGDGDVQSDIDLFVVRPDGVAEEDERWREQIAALGQHVLGWTGNHAAVVEVTFGDLSAMVSEKPPVLGELRRDGIDLGGQPLRRLLREVR